MYIKMKNDGRWFLFPPLKEKKSLSNCMSRHIRVLTVFAAAMISVQLYNRTSQGHRFDLLSTTVFI